MQDEKLKLGDVSFESRLLTGTGKFSSNELIPKMLRASKSQMITVALLSVVTACTTLNPYTREEETSNAVKGAAIGAAAGVAIGMISGSNSAERKKRALILGGAGALTGGGVGFYMDQQEMKLRQQLEGTGVSVTRIGDNITLNMPGNITFAVDSANISSLAQFRGKIVLLDFWASWCGPCRKSLPLYNQMYKELRNKEFEIKLFRWFTRQQFNCLYR